MRYTILLLLLSSSIFAYCQDEQIIGTWKHLESEEELSFYANHYYQYKHIINQEVVYEVGHWEGENEIGNNKKQQRNIVAYIYFHFSHELPFTMDMPFWQGGKARLHKLSEDTLVLEFLRGYKGHKLNIDQRKYVKQKESSNELVDEFPYPKRKEDLSSLVLSKRSEPTEKYMNPSFFSTSYLAKSWNYEAKLPYKKTYLTIGINRRRSLIGLEIFTVQDIAYSHAKGDTIFFILSTPCLTESYKEKDKKRGIIPYKAIGESRLEKLYEINGEYEFICHFRQYNKDDIEFNEKIELSTTDEPLNIYDLKVMNE